MLKYVARKLLLAIPLVWSVVTLVFVLIELSPGDVSDKFFNPETPPEVRELIIEKYHLDEPAGVRYLAMMRNLLTFDFGRSMAQERPVFDILFEALPNTLLLTTVSLLVLFPVGIGLGVLQAIRHGRALDSAASVGSLTLYSMPDFLLALILILGVYVFGQALDALVDQGTLARATARTLSLPLSGMRDAVRFDGMGPVERVVDVAKHLVLPGIGMALASAGGIARYVRSSMLEVIRQDYVRTARAKGLRERQVVVRHALRNAMLPVVTMIGLSVPQLFSGAVVVETIFAWPGMGRVLYSAILSQDTPVLIAAYYVFSLVVLASNLSSDLVYAWADPRIRYE